MKKISLNEENSITNGFSWYYAMVTDPGTASRVSDMIRCWAFSDERTSLHIPPSYSKVEARSTAIGRVDPVRRSMRREINRTGSIGRDAVNKVYIRCSHQLHIFPWHECDIRSGDLFPRVEMNGFWAPFPNREWAIMLTQRQNHRKRAPKPNLGSHA